MLIAGLNRYVWQQLMTSHSCDNVRYLVQSRSQNRHQEAVVDVTQQLRADGGMSDLRETNTC